MSRRIDWRQGLGWFGGAYTGKVDPVSEPCAMPDLLEDFCQESRALWAQTAATLPQEHTGRLPHGTVSFGCQIVGKLKEISRVELLRNLKNSAQYSRRGMLSVSSQKGCRPILRSTDGAWEASFASGQGEDQVFAEFWRATTAGALYQLESYSDDRAGLVTEGRTVRHKPGTHIELAEQSRRLCEFLLKADAIARHLAVGSSYTLQIECEWRGLARRKPYETSEDMFTVGGLLPASNLSREDLVRTTREVASVEPTAGLAWELRCLTEPLYLSRGVRLHKPHLSYKAIVECVKGAQLA